MEAFANPPPKSRYSTAVILTLLLLLAAGLRGAELQNPGYTLDELWTVEIAQGRGSVHLHLPVNTPLSPADLRAMTAPAPWPAVWTHMETTHPPFYYLLLRLWMQLLGQGDITERALSVLASLGAVALLFDTAKMLNGRSVAIWGCLLMIAASPQVDLARKTRNYAVAYLLLIAAANALVRIEKRGINRKRLAVLTLASLASALTHYFCAGVLIALLCYAMLRLRDKPRRHVLCAMGLAAFLFAITWVPFFWNQRSLLAVTDPGVSFVHDLIPDGHAGRVARLFLLAPATLLVARVHLGEWGYLLGVFFLIPLAILRRHPGLFLWYLWLTCSLGTVAMLDLTRASLHLGFVRYVSMAGPGLYVLIPATCAVSRWQWVRHTVPALILGWTVWFLSDAYTNPAADPRDIAALIRPGIAPADVLVFASGSDTPWYRGIQYLMLSRYLQPIPCPVIFLDSPPTGAALETLLASRGEFVFTSAQDPQFFLPGFVQRDEVPLPSWGRLTLMVPPKQNHGM